MVKSCNSQDIFLKKGSTMEDDYGVGSSLGRGGGGKGHDDVPRRGGGARDRTSRLDHGFAPSRSRTPPPRGYGDRDRARDRDRDRDGDFFSKGLGNYDKGMPKGYGKNFMEDGFGGKDPWFGKGMGPMGFWDPFGKGKGGYPPFRDPGFNNFRGGKGFAGFGGFGKDRFGPKGLGKDDRGKGGRGDRGRRSDSPEPSTSALDADLEEYFTGKRPTGSAAKELARELSSRGGSVKGKGGKGNPASESKLDMDLDSYMGRGQEEPTKVKEAKSDEQDKADAKAEGDALADEADKEVEPKVVGRGDRSPADNEQKGAEGGEKKADEEKKADS